MPSNYNSEYKEKIFLEWFNLGQPGGRVLQRHIPIDPLMGNVPVIETLQRWIQEEWTERADIINEQVKAELEGTIVKEKVEMLSRHAEIGKEITDKAIEYFRENEFTTSANALNALVQGVRIEKESRGIPDALQKMQTTSDEKLAEEVYKLLEKGQITIEPNE
jgi:hypothetical protein